MKLYEVNCEIKNVPKLDPNFIPMEQFHRSFLKTATKPLAIAIERESGHVSVYETRIHGTQEMQKADFYYVERLVKFLLWAKGGFKVTICGDEAVFNHIRTLYSEDGERAFDAKTMADVYEKPFEVGYRDYNQKPAQNESSKPLGGHMDGCRIGFDAGGSDRKVSAVMDGKVLYSEEVVWHPKTTSDPDYHFNEIVAALKTAASKLPRVDAIGISSAGIYVNNRTMLASLFLKVPKDLFDLKVKNIYERACREIGDVPFVVANDGDVTALAGAMDLNDNGILGIAMGTSEAVGYVDDHGNVTGWLNELAFAPVDAHPDAMEDEWSGDIGCGVKYFSQDSVIKLAPRAGIELSDDLTPAQKLKEVQKLAEQENESALDIFDSIGCYLGHTLPFYARFYNIKHLLLLGRVTSGKGGERMLAKCRAVLNDEYPELDINIVLPDEKSRRVGQSVAAAGLPVIK
ncbi:MAG: ROK family protein [Oscillospiraceae bacterium]|jgi:predicted NBD/HSP70 family sugar kinase|nr:ROK family protein [Oscillospiraceae bacterium]